MDMFDRMRSFIMVVKCGCNQTFAASKLHTSASNLSKQITTLEERLQTKLFKGPKKKTLTEEGWAFYSRASDIFKEFQDLVGTMTSDQKELIGSITVTVLATIGLEKILKAYFDFLDKHPHVRLESDYSNYRPTIIDGDYDVAIYIEPLADPRVTSIQLYETSRTIYGAPSYFKKYGKPKTLDDLKKHNCLLYSCDPLKNIWVLGGNDNSIVVEGNFHSDSQGTLFRALIHGQGLLILPNDEAEHFVKEGLVEPVLQQYTKGKVKVSAYYKDDANKIVKEFLEYLKKHFQKIS